MIIWMHSYPLWKLLWPFSESEQNSSVENNAIGVQVTVVIAASRQVE